MTQNLGTPDLGTFPPVSNFVFPRSRPLDKDSRTSNLFWDWTPGNPNVREAKEIKKHPRVCCQAGYCPRQLGLNPMGKLWEMVGNTHISILPQQWESWGMYIPTPIRPLGLFLRGATPQHFQPGPCECRVEDVVAKLQMLELSHLGFLISQSGMARQNGPYTNDYCHFHP